MMMLLGTFDSPPLPLLPWLTCQTIITDKLRTLSPDVIMTILSSKCESANWWECQVLGLANKDKVLRREILMSTGMDNCWYARTIIPNATYAADLAFFDRLKHTTLATLIYYEPRVNRTLLHSYSVTKTQLEYHWARQWCEDKSILWVRFSHFLLDNKHQFYLVELFLPGLERALLLRH